MAKVDFRIHDLDTAPEGARQTLHQVRAKFGFVPNILGIMAESPQALQAYVTLSALFDGTSLSDAERAVVLLTVSGANGCDYCVAAHTAGARATKVSSEVIDAARSGKPIPDAKLEALRRLASAVTETRGWPGDADVQAFLDAGYTRAQVLEVLVGVAMKTLSNYTNHLAETPVDEPLKQHAAE